MHNKCNWVTDSESLLWFWVDGWLDPGLVDSIPKLEETMSCHMSHMSMHSSIYSMAIFGLVQLQHPTVQQHCWGWRGCSRGEVAPSEGQLIDWLTDCLTVLYVLCVAQWFIYPTRLLDYHDQLISFSSRLIVNPACWVQVQVQVYIQIWSLAWSMESGV